MKIYIGSDHAGYDLKEEIVKYLSNEYEVINCGPFNKDSVDYPDYAVKFKGVRAALVGIPEDAVLTREHNNANVLCLSAKNTSVDVALEIVDKFLNTDFTYGRHERRVNKIIDLDVSR